MLLVVTRGSVTLVANSYHDKNSRHDKKLVLESIYIIDISIYLDLPARGTDRKMYRLSIERIISISISI